ncbi:MAG TPA: hypothetical protein VF572_03865 [Candidatus Saccharimonadales bacterium]|jgi:hypothetical protein
MNTLSSNPEVATVPILDGILYHGSAFSSIKEFRSAGETTVGDGLYTLNNSDQAEAYAHKRAREYGGSPVLYALGVEQATLVDLDDQQTLDVVMGGFRHAVLDAMLEEENDWIAQGALVHTLERIGAGVKVGNVKRVTQVSGNRFSGYLASQGFDGLKTWEGGEGPTIGNHEAHLIFDPGSVEILHEQHL